MFSELCTAISYNIIVDVHASLVYMFNCNLISEHYFYGEKYLIQNRN